MAKVRDKKLCSEYGDALLDRGFTSYPNFIFDLQKELGLRDSEMLFFVKVQRYSRTGYMVAVSDHELFMQLTKRQVRRIRKSLQDKGYLRYIIEKERDDKGRIKTVGVIYNWQGLCEAARKIIARNREDIFDTHREDIFDTSLIIEKNKHVLKEQQQKKENVVVVLINKLVKRGLNKDVAEKLVSNYRNRIEQKIEMFDVLMDQGKIKKSPAGWLVKAIVDDYVVDVEKVDDEKMESSVEEYKQLKKRVEEEGLNNLKKNMELIRERKSKEVDNE